jgi:hypothetical protein
LTRAWRAVNCQSMVAWCSLRSASRACTRCCKVAVSGTGRERQPRSKMLISSRALLPHSWSSPIDYPHCPRWAANPDPTRRGDVPVRGCGSAPGCRLAAIFSGSNRHFATLASREAAVSSHSWCAAHRAMHSRWCVDYDVEDDRYVPLETMAPAGSIRHRLGWWDRCVSSYTPAYLTPPFLFFPQFPNGL